MKLLTELYYEELAMQFLRLGHSHSGYDCSSRFVLQKSKYIKN